MSTDDLRRAAQIARDKADGTTLPFFARQLGRMLDHAADACDEFEMPPSADVQAVAKLILDGAS